jgi:hypothetical protein
VEAFAADWLRQGSKGGGGEGAERKKKWRKKLRPKNQRRRKMTYDRDGSMLGSWGREIKESRG